MKISVTTLLSILCLLLIGACLGFIGGSLLGVCGFDIINIYYWVTIATFLFVALVVLHLYHIKREESEKIQTTTNDKNYVQMQTDASNLRDDFERFKRESLHFFKAQMKIFLHYASKQEGEEKKILKEFNNEIADIRWGHDLMEEIKAESNKRQKNNDSKS